ncbi:hypothetical protein W97_04917 [Coniosporium apollinis CBS 100218]|uniref:Uncharacterized protein n=1 Tax=Coniosporium apollinis (strain CBS 100218) TaxID=1168221 RepID=R7YV14_CONA1|nr:uncharacterized protein W97_04917 [Coniosporium apollinis CBS 100218]EON65678.1 hypothetical protein W97_04917 [Coniosporium apollinis CBS 100218]
MPAFTTLTRNYSWPPLFNLIAADPDSGAHEPALLPDMDEDPFAHFLTPLREEDDPFDGLALSAGILPGETAKASASASKAAKFCERLARRWERYVERYHADLHGAYHEPSDEPPSLIPPYSIDATAQADARLGSEWVKVEVRQPRPEPTRGRAQEIIGAGKRNRRGRRTSRTLSGHRHSWREPSVDLFTVMEEKDMGTEAVARDGVPAIVVTAPCDDDDGPEDDDGRRLSSKRWSAKKARL